MAAEVIRFKQAAAKRRQQRRKDEPPPPPPVPANGGEQLERIKGQLLQLAVLKGWDYIDTLEAMYDHWIRYDTDPDFRKQMDREMGRG